MNFRYRPGFAGTVVCRRREAEANHRLVSFGRVLEETGETGRLTDHYGQNARGNWIESSKMAYSASASDTSRPCHDVVRGPALRLVDDDHSVGRRRCPSRGFELV